MIVKIKSLINFLFILNFFKERFIFRINVNKPALTPPLTQH